ncbi:MAG: hypothetical protein V4465_00635 [Patescibacteria group bacterium]
MNRFNVEDCERVFKYALEYAQRIAAELDRMAEFAKAVEGTRSLDSSDLRALPGHFRAVFTNKSGEQRFQVGEDVSSIREALELLRISEEHPQLNKRIYDEQGNPILLEIMQLQEGDKFRRVNTPPDGPIQFDDLLEFQWWSALEGSAGFKRLRDEVCGSTGSTSLVVKITDA